MTMKITSSARPLVDKKTISCSIQPHPHSEEHIQWTVENYDIPQDVKPTIAVNTEWGINQYTWVWYETSFE